MQLRSKRMGCINHQTNVVLLTESRHGRSIHSTIYADTMM